MKELNIRELQDRLDAIAIKEENEFDREESKKLQAISKLRPEVKVSMVAPALEKLLAEYQKDIEAYNNERAEVEAELKAKGMSDKEIEDDIFNGDYDFHYYDIDALEDKFNALDELLKKPDEDGNSIVGVMYSGPSDTSSREDFGREIKSAIKQDHPEVYDKLFMYDVGESQIKEQVLDESPAGDALQSAYDKVYNFVGEYDDAALEYLNDNAPIFSEMFDKYDGEFDVMASNLDADTLQQVMDELNDVAFDLESGVLESKTEEQELEEFKSLIGRTGGVMGFKN